MLNRRSKTHKLNFKTFLLKTTKISLITGLLLFCYFLIGNTFKVAQSESAEQVKEPEKERDYLAIGVNAGTLVTCALGIGGTIWVASKQSTEAQYKVKEALDKDLKIITDSVANKNDEGLKRDLNTKTELTSAINEIKTLLVSSTGNSALAIAEMRRDLEKSISVNLAEIVRVHHKFEVSTFETEAALEAQEKAYKHLDEKISLSNDLAEQRYVNLQREIQVLLRQFHYRLSDTEKVLEAKHGFTPRREPINLDIEGLG